VIPPAAQNIERTSTDCLEIQRTRLQFNEPATNRISVEGRLLDIVISRTRREPPCRGNDNLPLE
jgi:hypothetical protein